MWSVTHQFFNRTNAGIKPALLTASAMTLVLSLSGCQFFEPNDRDQIVSESGKKIDMNDATVRQYLSEWNDSKDSIERLADMEGDLSFLLSEVSKLSDIGRTPGLSAPALPAPIGVVPKAQAAPVNVITPAPVVAPVIAVSHSAPTVNVQAPAVGLQAPVVRETLTPTGSHSLSPSPSVAAPVITGGGTSTYLTEVPTVTSDFNFDQALCSENFQNFYKKSLAFVSFPRTPSANSALGRLHQVEQHLPMLLGANLRNRHNMLTPVQLRGALGNADQHEIRVAAQAKELARQHRVQFLVSGEVDDMAMTYPSKFDEPNYYTRFVNGVHNIFNVDTRLDKRMRVFSFRLDVRDGLTGNIVFSQNYRTFGKWKAAPNQTVGFASPQFWQTDYGVQVQHLVGRASDEIAASLNCQPYVARVDTVASQQMVVVQSGANNGMRTGDKLDLFKVVYQPIPGQYQQYDTRLLSQSGSVYLTEVYPSHSVGRVSNQSVLQGQFVIKSN